MLTRVGVVGSGKLEATAKKAAKARSVEIRRLDDVGAMPPGVMAVLADSDQIDVALDMASRLSSRANELLNLLAASIDRRELSVTGGSQRVTALAAYFGQALKLDADDQWILERGALLRDVGKIEIPNEILLKYGVLSFEEWSTIRLHTELGAKLVSKLDALQDVADIVHRHHECFDGDGYPGGLEKEKIPLLARVVKIVDVFCAMTSPRHYRKTLFSPEEALDFIKEESGKHFDPELVKVFVSKRLAEKSVV